MSAPAATAAHTPTTSVRAPEHAKRLWAVDAVRVLAVAGVIAVHAVGFVAVRSSDSYGVATVMLHANREVFFFITACVLCYVYGRRPSWSLPAFWRKRYLLVATPYVIWTIVYLLADGGPFNAERLWLALLRGDARYHLYFLLVTMQVYLLFPLLLWLVRVTRRHHALLVGVSVTLQMAFTVVAHYAPRHSGPLAGWFARPDPILPSYQAYILLGAVVAYHLDGFRDWLRSHVTRTVALVLAGVAACIALYAVDRARGLSPTDAAAVFSPAVTIESFAAVVGLLAFGVAWTSRTGPRTGRFIANGADASFGIYLCHPLLLQGLLLAADSAGVLVWSRGQSQPLVVLVTVLVVVPAVFLTAWGLTAVFRYTPLSLPLTGRPARRWGLPKLTGRRRPQRAAEPAREPALSRR